MDGRRVFDSECNQWALLQVGVTPRIELGVDRCFEQDAVTYANLKLILSPERGTRPAIAVGIQAIGSGADREPYLVLSKCINRVQIHLGAVRRSDETRGMLGVQHDLGPGVALLADHVTGSGNASSIGVVAPLGPKASAKLARVFAHSSGADASWMMVVSLALSLPR
jgi:hypothetical protein